ncbi:hypothetical protein MMC11_007611 [Xylographa trunciseda]|nr:hypothetical protein [Xylographa trunciseda]
MPTIIRTQIDIAATPAEVRKALLDFDSYPEWAKAHIKSIQLASGDTDEIKPGDKLKVSLTGMSFSSKVKTNTPEEFTWLGSIPGVFHGEHAFRFRPSTTSPGHTNFVHEEEFSGMLSFLIGPSWSEGKKTKAGYEGFNRELKERVEGLPRGTGAAGV